MKHMFITVCTVAVCIVSILILGGCSSEPTKNTTTQQQDTSWYPLAVGNTWIYRYVRSGNIIGYDTVRVTGTIRIKGVEYYQLKYSNSNSTDVSMGYTRLRGNDTLVSYRRPNNDSRKDSAESIDYVFSQDTSSKEYNSYWGQGGVIPRRTISLNDTLTVNGTFYSNLLVFESISANPEFIGFCHFKRGVGMINRLYLPQGLGVRKVHDETSLVSFRSASNF